MRRGPVIVVLAALVAAGAAVGSVAAAEPAAPRTVAALRAPFPPGVLDTTPDLGPAAEVAAVRAAAARVLDDQSRAFAIDARWRHDPRPAVLRRLTAPAAEASRLRVLQRTRSPALAREMARAFDWYAEHDFGPGRRFPGDRDVYAAARFHVDSWQGVQVVGGTARAVVMGEARGRDWAGRPKRDAWAQYRMLFHRDGSAAHGWRLVRTEAASPAA